MVRGKVSKIALRGILLGGVAAAVLLPAAGLSRAATIPNPAMPAPAVRVRSDVATLCTLGSWKWADHGYEVLYNDAWGPGDKQCVTDPSDGPGFTVTRSTTPTVAWQGFPDLIGSGCWYNICTQHGQLPMSVGDIHTVTERLITRYPAGQWGDDADDWWFSYHRTGNAHPNALELMIWASWQHVPLHHAVLVRIGGHRWLVEQWRTRPSAGTQGWRYVQLRDARDRPGDLYDLNLVPIFRWLEKRGWLEPSWWAMCFNAGFEIVQHGARDGIYSYRLVINGHPEP